MTQRMLQSQSPEPELDGPAADRPIGRVERRTFLKTAAVVAGAAALTPFVGRTQEDRDYGPEASPVHYPDPDVVSVTPAFDPYRVGNSAIQRLWTGGFVVGGSGLEWGRPVLPLERHPQRYPAPLAGGGRPGQRLPQPLRQQQRQHLRLGGAPDLLPARQPPGGPLRARRHRHRPGRHLRGQAIQLAQRRGRPSRTAASGSPTRPTARRRSAATRATPASSYYPNAVYRIDPSGADRAGDRRARAPRTASASRTTTRSSTSSTPGGASATSRSSTWSTRPR